MNQNTALGYLIVNVSTARGAIPLAGASVTVMFEEPENTSVFAVLSTDTSGKTERISLPAPERALSESPGNIKPYASYTLKIDREGYYPVTDAGVPIFADITSIQPVEMLPLAEYDSDTVYPREGIDFAEDVNPDL